MKFVRAKKTLARQIFHWPTTFVLDDLIERMTLSIKLHVCKSKLSPKQNQFHTVIIKYADLCITVGRPIQVIITQICIAKFSRSAGPVVTPELPARRHFNQTRAGSLAVVANTVWTTGFVTSLIFGLFCSLVLVWLFGCLPKLSLTL